MPFIQCSKTSKTMYYLGLQRDAVRHGHKKTKCSEKWFRRKKEQQSEMKEGPPGVFKGPRTAMFYFFISVYENICLLSYCSLQLTYRFKIAFSLYLTKKVFESD